MPVKTVLGIETSCDDTSIAVIRGETGVWEKNPEILSHVTFGQGKILEKWGGVVPEIAARNHLEKIAPLIQEALNQSKLSFENLDVVAVTCLPGLLGPLLTGINAAKTISLIKKTPICPVNHLFAHLEAIHLTEKIPYPYLGLLVSGGHSLYAIVRGPLDFEVIGTTLDDAAGEAFDKGGKLLDLGYPAGKIIDDLAKEGRSDAFSFPIGLKSSADCNLSYSGVKTSLRTKIEELGLNSFFDNGIPNQLMKDVCASYQKAIIDALILKTRYALKLCKEKGLENLPIVVGGGVACNSELRKSLSNKYKNVSIVAPKFCTDNGAMIASMGLRTFAQALKFPESLNISATSRYLDKFQPGKKT